MTTLKPYPAYRDSGVEWLGDVPNHWTVPRLKQVCVGPPEYGANVSAQNYSGDGVRFVRTTDIREDGQLRTKGGVYIDKSYVEDALLEVGDFLISRSSTIGRALVVDERTPLPAAFAGYLVRFRTRDVPTAKWVHLFTQTAAFSGFISTVVISSTIENVNGQKYANMSIPLPPLDEQRAIAAFLDAMDARITRFIAARKKMIRLLEEKKQAVINQAVTKGLDPTVPMRDSGVDWLGEIPAHWEVRKVGALTSLIQTGPFGSQLPASDYVDDGVPLINPSHIDGGRLNPDSGIAVSEQTAERLSRHRFHVGDIVLARRGEMGRCAVVREGEAGWLCGTGSLLIRPKHNLISPVYLQLVLSNRSLAGWLELTSAGATMSNLNTTMAASISAPVPPIVEQGCIAELVEKQQERTSALVDRAQREIELMQEYRIRLISDVVTGKLDVRGVELPTINASLGDEFEAATEVDGETQPLEEFEEIES